MKTIPETDNDLISDIRAPCFQMLSTKVAEVVRECKIQVLFRNALTDCMVFLVEKRLSEQDLKPKSFKQKDRL